MSDPVVDTTTLPNDVAGLLEAVKQERRAKADALSKAAAAEQRVTALAAEVEAAKTAKEAELATLRTAAEAWQAHTAAQVKARDDANAAKLAAMPEAQRATISALGLDGEKLSQLLSALTPAPDPAQPATTATPAQTLAAPVIPAGGAVPGGAQSAGLAPEIVKWVETSRKDLRGASNAAVEAAYKSYGPGAKAPK